VKKMLSLFKRKPVPDSVYLLYQKIVDQSRLPIFYEELKISDDTTGRFELLTLHMFFILNSLKNDKQFGQQLFDAMFTDMDLSLREMGVSDLGVGRRIKALAQKFYHRIANYEEHINKPTIKNILHDYFYINQNGDFTVEIKNISSYITNQLLNIQEQNIDKIISAEVTMIKPVIV
jgi:cytochrome b pre-mRNA-processing protein 3